jgi:hypothetical protein
MELNGLKRMNNEEFLVPSILPEDSILEAPPTVLMSAMVVFSEKQVVRLWQKKSYMSLEEILNEGFVPAGIFSRLIGSVASQCQQTEPSTQLAEMIVKNNSASF